MNPAGMAKECQELRRWKSTHAPRLEALESMLRGAQLGAAAGLEARQSLASERAANAVLAEEVERARAVIEQCRAALAEELSAPDIDPPLHHVKTAHDACVEWLSGPNVRAKRATTAGRQARACDNVRSTTGQGLVACRWRSA